MEQQGTQTRISNRLSSILWLISHYEESKGVFVSQGEILSHAENCGLAWNGVQLGRVISCVWNGNVVRSRSTLSSTPGYLNIKKIVRSDGNDQRIEKLDEDSFPKLQRLCFNRSDWVVNCSLDRTVITYIKLPATGAILHIDDRPIFCEVSASLSKNTVTIRTHGDAVRLTQSEHTFQHFVPVSVESIDTIIRAVDAASLCIGNVLPSETKSNEHLLKSIVLGSKLVIVTLSDLKMEKRLVSTSCLLLRFGVKACENCRYVFQLWKSREWKRNRSGKDDVIGNRFINERCLARPGLEAKLLSQKGEIVRSQRQLKKYDEMIELAEIDSQDMRVIFDGIATDRVPTNIKLLWEMQAKQMSAKSSYGHRWDPRIIRLALDIYCKNPRALDIMRQCIVLPSNRLLRYYKNSVSQQPGWNIEVLNWCRKEAERLKLTEENHWGGLIFDEMKIQEDLQMKVRDGKHELVGMVELGQFHNDVKHIETGSQAAQIATHILQFIFLSDGGFRFPVAHFPTAQCPPSTLYFKFWEGVLLMKQAGFTIYHSICDGGDSNRQFIKMHFTDHNPIDDHFATTNMITGDRTVFIMDCKHKFKKLRNNLEKSSLSGTVRCFTKAGQHIFWAYWKEAYEWDQRSNSCPIHEKLTEDHFVLTPSSRMRNSLAEDLLDKRMYHLMKV
ncbi:uncharacterized protein LOC114517214 [Dendronephthya gigantea]|uniref:uncharacterized protein LOC114517214 n=1 Tax=Dendronephthya gigantea TaxID=151771 RepID=UPI00106BB66F|nr:uncharacterized protein LOC114517214 [Dendronephthya gigantea]